jgi:hypothetical protein
VKALPLKYGVYALLGVVVGVFSGLFGVGGGIIMVPFLVVVAGYTQQVAQGISLAVIIPTACSGVVDYWQKGTFNVGLVPLTIALAIGSIPSAKYGAALAQRLPQDTLKTLFALFMVAMAARIMPSNSLRSMSLLLGMSLVAVGVRLMLVR